MVTDLDTDTRPDSKLWTEQVSNGHSAAPTGRSSHVLIVECEITGLVAAISLKEKGIPVHDCRGGDGIPRCKSFPKRPPIFLFINDACYQINTLCDSCGKQVGAGVRLSPKASREKLG
jgi:hypothetical protein